MNYLNKLIIVSSSDIETDFSETKDPVAFLDSIKNVKYR